MMQFPYATAEAFDAALTDRLSAVHETSRHSINELRRQFAYDRLLVRIFQDPSSSDSWILKGGGGLLARIPDRARHSMDLDLFYAGEFDDAIEALQELAHRDLGDFFDFDVTLLRGAPTTGVRRLKVASFIGNKVFEPFRIDLVVASNMTQPPDSVDPLTPIVIPGLSTCPYRVYSLVDHIADKHAAMVDTYNDNAPSTRYRDLVDLVLIATTQRPDAADLRSALLSEYSVRNLPTPTDIDLPAATWAAGYANAIEALPDVSHRTASDALNLVRALLQPLLDNRIPSGTWNPDISRWEPHVPS